MVIIYVLFSLSSSQCNDFLLQLMNNIGVMWCYFDLCMSCIVNDVLGLNCKFLWWIMFWMVFLWQLLHVMMFFINLVYTNNYILFITLNIVLWNRECMVNAYYLLVHVKGIFVSHIIFIFYFFPSFIQLTKHEFRFHLLSFLSKWTILLPFISLIFHFFYFVFLSVH